MEVAASDQVAGLWTKPATIEVSEKAKIDEVFVEVSALLENTER
jgi:hypothetical protein